MARTNPKTKKTITGDIESPLHDKLVRIAEYLQRTKTDLVGSIVSNWIASADEEKFRQAAQVSISAGLMPLDAQSPKRKP
jgi:hypothetical protein